MKKALTLDRVRALSFKILSYGLGDDGRLGFTVLGRGEDGTFGFMLRGFGEAGRFGLIVLWVYIADALPLELDEIAACEITRFTAATMTSVARRDASRLRLRCFGRDIMTPLY